MRGKDRIEAIVELTDKLDPYEHPFLGVLPKRSLRDGRDGVVVRYVYPESPADKAGVRPGDRLVSLQGEPVKDAGTMQETVATLDCDKKVKLEYERSGTKTELEVGLATLPSDVPDALPPARDPVEPSGADRPAVGIVEIKIPEEPNECFAYVPPKYDPEVGHGVVVHLHAPGEFDRDRLVTRWKGLCEQNDLILLAPKSAGAKRWERTEVDFVQKAVEDLVATYHVDRTRVVVHGYQGGGSMAYLVGLTHRDQIRGVAAVDAALPPRTRPPANDPIYRLAFYTTTAEKSPLAARIDEGVKTLRSMKYPVTTIELGQTARPLNAEELAELVRWIDTLDRI